MNFKDRLLKKSNLWHVGAIALFLLISCVYFSPALNGYTLKQGDVTNFIGMSREIKDYRENDGEQVLWTNAMFAGMPATQISILYEGTFLTSASTSILRFGLPAPIFYLFVYFIGFYILALSLKIKPLVAMVGSVAFGLSSYFIIILEAGHNTKASAIGLAPLMIAGFILAYRMKNWVLGVGLASLFMAIQLAANHIQITYYMAILLGLLGIAELYRHIKTKELEKFFKVTGFLLVGYVFAVMINYGNIFGTMEYAKNTIRGGTELTINAQGESTEEIKTDGLDREYVTNWSYGKGETFTLIFPNFKGGETQAIGTNEANEDILKDRTLKYAQQVAQSNQYWGDQPFTSGPVYVGMIVFFLAILALVYVNDRSKWAFLAATLLAITLSWGKNYVSAIVILPILLYLVNIFLEKKQQLLYTGIITLLLFFAIANGDMFVSISLTDFFLDYIPGYNKLRAVTIILAVVELCLPLLGVLFLQQLFSRKEEIAKDMKGFFIVTGVLSVFCLGLLAFPTLFNTFLSAQDIAMLDNATDPETKLFFENVYADLEVVRITIFRADVLRSFLFLLFASGLMLAYLKTNFNKIAFGASIGVLILLDLLFVDLRYINTDGTRNSYDQWTEVYKQEYPFTAGEGEKAILAYEIQKDPTIATKIDSALQVLESEFKGQDIDGREKQVRRDFLTFRVLNRNTNFRVYEEGNPFNSSYTSYFNKSIGGYHGAKLGRYQDLIEFHLANRNPSVINMLNTKYYLRPQRGPQGIEGTQLTRINPNALGNAWLTKKVKIVPNANEEITAMEAYKSTRLINSGLFDVQVNGKSVQEFDLTGREAVSLVVPNSPEPIPVNNIPYDAASQQNLALIVQDGELKWIPDNPADSLSPKIFSLMTGTAQGWSPLAETIIDQRYEDNLSKKVFSGNGSIDLISYHPDKLVYKFNSSEEQLAVFSEIFYDQGWKAYVDEQETPILRVNYLLRALEVPSGEHTIRFEYELPSFEKAKTIAIAGSLAILLIIGFGFFIETKKKSEEKDSTVDVE